MAVKLNLRLFLIVALCMILGIIIAEYLKANPIQMPSFLTRCYFDTDCAWVITNCCRETAGAKWECVSTKTYKPIDCPDIVICPQVISPKPDSLCVCEQGNCVVYES